MKDKKFLFPPTPEELAALRQENTVRKSTRNLVLNVQELAAEVIMLRKRIRELENANALLAKEITQVRGHNACHLNEIQRVALEKDRYASALDQITQRSNDR